MTPEQRARLERYVKDDGPRNDQHNFAFYVAAALAHIDALEARVGELEAVRDDLDQQITKNDLQDATTYRKLREAEAEVQRLREGTYTDAEARTWWSDAHMKRAELEAKTYQDLLQVEQAEKDALAAERDALRATVRGWLDANAPGGWIDDLRTAKAQAERTAAARLAVLRELEWQWDEQNGAYGCPLCPATKGDDHHVDCRLGAALAPTKEEA